DPFGLTRLPDSVQAGPTPFSGEQGMFASPSGAFRIIFVRARDELVTYRDCERWLEAVRTAADAVVSTSLPGQEVSLGYTGRPAFVTEIAKGMERDTTASVLGTAVIIACLFWIAHRRWKPMLWLLGLLAMILLSTLALGGLTFGAVNVVSMGF